MIFKSTTGELAVFVLIITCSSLYSLLFSCRCSLFIIVHHPCILIWQKHHLPDSFGVPPYVLFFSLCLSSQFCLLDFFSIFSLFFPHVPFLPPLFVTSFFPQLTAVKTYCLPLPHKPFTSLFSYFPQALSLMSLQFIFLTILLLSPL